MAEKFAKKRRPNFTVNEISALVDAIHAHKSILMGKFDGSSITNATKDAAWNAVVNAVNSVSLCIRTVDEVKKKWIDHKSSTKRRAGDKNAQIRKTGGGPPAKIYDANTGLESKTLEILGPLAVEGIIGGYDSMFSSSSIIKTDLVELDEALNDEAFSDPVWDQYCPGHSTYVQEAAGCAPATLPTPVTSSIGCCGVVSQKVRLTPSTCSTSTVGQEHTASKRTVAHLVKLQQDTVNALKEMVAIEKDRAAMEKERLNIERELLAIEQEKLIICRVKHDIDSLKQKGDIVEIQFVAREM